MAVVALLLASWSHLAAQTALAQLGLTEAAARSFVLDEVKSPSLTRTSAVALTGTRAFLKLPPSARGAAATGVLAWLKAYVNSPAFKASYDGYRRDRIPQPRPEAMTVEEAVRKDTDELLAGIAQMRASVPQLPAEQQKMVLDKLREQEAMLKSAEYLAQRRAHFEALRSDASSADADYARRVEEALPADPRVLIARRLHEFLTETAEVNFSARTFALNGDANGIVFRDAADRKRHWLWQQAVIVGPEATAAARAAAESWLREIE
jgi:hypothetical protein